MPNPVKSPSNSITCNCQKIWSWSRRPKTKLKIRKKAILLQMINNPINHKSFKDFTNHRKKTNRVVVFSCRPFPDILNAGNTYETFQQSGKQTPSGISWRIREVFMKVQALSSLEPPMEYNQDEMFLMNQGLLWSFYPSWEFWKYYEVWD